MATLSSALWLLVAGSVLSQSCCQHWSYGLRPGGKRELNRLPETLDPVVEGFPHDEVPCSVLGCAEESPFTEIHRMKGFLNRATARESGHKPSKE